MASIRREIVIDASAERVWDALCDWGALHLRLVPGFATDVRLDGEDRIVTVATGSVLRERLVDLDDAARRLVWSIADPPTPTTTQPRRCLQRERTAAGSCGPPTSSHTSWPSAPPH